MQIQNVHNFLGVNPVRQMVDEKGEPWFVAKDVCDCLGQPNPSMVLSKLDPDEFQVIDFTAISNTYGNQIKDLVNVVSEAGLYSLILRSRKPEAKTFKRWITHEVLPSIRKTGGYIMAKPEETPEEIMARALLVAQESNVFGEKICAGID